MTVDLAGVCTGNGVCDTTHTSTSTTDNWVARAGGLPPYVLAYVHAFMRKGMPRQRAISMAIGVLEDIAAGRRKVTPATRARAQAAIAQWNAMRAQARSHSHTAEDAMTVIDLAGDPLMRLDKPALIALAKKAEKITDVKKRAMIKARIAVRARQLGMKPDGDGDYDYDVPAGGASMSEAPCSCRTADLAITAAERKAAPVHYPGTTKFPIRNQHDFDSAWMLRGRSSLPAAAVEKWLRGVAQRFGYKIPGDTK